MPSHGSQEGRAPRGVATPRRDAPVGARTAAGYGSKVTVTASEVPNPHFPGPPRSR